MDTQNASAPSSSFERFTLFLLPLLIFLLPIFVIPSSVVAIEVGKSLYAVIGISLILFLSLILIIKRGKVEFPRHPVMWGIVAVPAVFLLSALVNADKGISLLGYSLETGTAAFIFIGSILFLLTALLSRAKEYLAYSYAALSWAFAIVALFALAKLFFGANALSFGALVGVVATPVGSWTSLAMFFGAALVLISTALEIFSPKPLAKALLWLGFVLSLFMLAVTNFSAVWLTLFIFAILFFVWKLSTYWHRSEGQGKKLRVSYLALVVIIVSGIFLLNPSFTPGGQKLGDIVAQRFSVSNLEVRPSLGVTLDIAGSVLKARPLLGSGPNTFDSDWFLYKVPAINATQFWNTDFPDGFGLLPTFIATTGILGALAWLLFFYFYLRLAVLAFRRSWSDARQRFFISSSFLASLFLWIMAFVAVPSVALFLLAFFFSGVFVASNAAFGTIERKSISFGQSTQVSFIAIFGILALLIGIIAFAYASTTAIASSVYFQKAVAETNTGADPDAIIADLTKADALSPRDLYERSLAQAGLLKMNQIISAGSANQAQAAANLQSALQATILHAQKATTLRPDGYENWTTLGQVYDALVPAPLSVAGAYDKAKAAYEQAQTLNPQSPEPSLLLARLEIDNSNPTGAFTDIQKALALKQDYADAYYLLAQLEASQNNLTVAIQAAQAAATLSPGNAGVFFELGLLEYSNKDYTDAVTALNQALRVEPDYANAQYFLGLSLAYLGQYNQAIAEFQALDKSNPGNQDVEGILANLQAGRAPLYQAPTTPTKSGKRSTPPIANQAQ